LGGLWADRDQSATENSQALRHHALSRVEQPKVEQPIGKPDAGKEPEGGHAVFFLAAATSPGAISSESALRGFGMLPWARLPLSLQKRSLAGKPIELRHQPRGPLEGFLW
jgi:hypothetical protein